MQVRNALGFLFAAVLFGIFGLYVHTHEITTVAAMTFGGGLLFCGMLIDFDHIVELIKAWKGQP